MKKLSFLVSCVLALALMFGCSNDDSTSSDSPEQKSVQELITAATPNSIVLITAGKLAENTSLSITKPITLSGGETQYDAKGVTITISVPNVTVKNIKNIKELIVEESVGDGDVFINSCQIVTATIKGGGSNSVHFINSTVAIMNSFKKSVHLILEDICRVFTMSIQSACQIEALNAQTIIKNIVVDKSVDEVTVSGKTKIESLVTNSDTNSTKTTIKVDSDTVTIQKAANKKEDASGNVTVESIATSGTSSVTPKTMTKDEVTQTEQSSDTAKDTPIDSLIKLPSIAGSAFYTNKDSHAGILITLTPTDGFASADLLEDEFVRSATDYRSATASRAAATVQNASTITKSDGSYEFFDIAPGTYTIYASSDNSTQRAVQTNVTVSTSRSATPTDLKLTATSSISGKITLDGKATGNGGILVFVSSTSYMAVTGDDGAFTISNVPLASNYIIAIMKGDFYTVWKTAVSVTDTGANLGTKDIVSSEIATGLIWKGSFASADDTALKNPKQYWAYYNTTDGCSYIYVGSSWALLASKGDKGDPGETGKDGTGTPGADGISLVWKGSFASADEIESPQTNWAYFNTTDGCSYIYDGEKWTLLAKAGKNGEDGKDGASIEPIYSKIKFFEDYKSIVGTSTAESLVTTGEATFTWGKTMAGIDSEPLTVAEISKYIRKDKTTEEVVFEGIQFKSQKGTVDASPWVLYKEEIATLSFPVTAVKDILLTNLTTTVSFGKSSNYKAVLRFNDEPVANMGQGDSENKLTGGTFEINRTLKAGQTANVQIVLYAVKDITTPNLTDFMHSVGFAPLTLTAVSSDVFEKKEIPAQGIEIDAPDKITGGKSVQCYANIVPLNADVDKSSFEWFVSAPEPCNAVIDKNGVLSVGKYGYFDSITVTCSLKNSNLYATKTIKYVPLATEYTLATETVEGLKATDYALDSENAVWRINKGGTLTFDVTGRCRIFIFSPPENLGTISVATDSQRAVKMSTRGLTATGDWTGDPNDQYFVYTDTKSTVTITALETLNLCTVLVRYDDTIDYIPIEAVSIYSKDSYADSGKTMQLNAYVSPANATYGRYCDFTWSITKGSEYATIDQNGLLTAKKFNGSNQYVTVRCTIDDGSGLYAEETVYVYSEIPFTALSGTTIPEGATVLYKASNASTSVLASAEKQTWWNDGGALFSIDRIAFGESAEVIKVTTQKGSCGGFGGLSQSVAPGQKLVISVYTANGLSFKPVPPDEEFTVIGKSAWQLYEIPYETSASLSQLGFVGNDSAEKSIHYIDAIYIVKD